MESRPPARLLTCVDFMVCGNTAFFGQAPGFSQRANSISSSWPGASELTLCLAKWFIEPISVSAPYTT